MPLPPPTALPIASVRAAVGYADRDSLTAPMRGTGTKSNEICMVRKSWGWTSRAPQCVVTGMDAADDLIAQLSTRIAMIMEDASAAALETGSLKGHELDGAIVARDIAATRIRALVEAMKALSG